MKARRISFAPLESWWKLELQVWWKVPMFISNEFKSCETNFNVWNFWVVDDNGYRSLKFLWYLLIFWYWASFRKASHVIFLKSLFCNSINLISIQTYFSNRWYRFIDIDIYFNIFLLSIWVCSGQWCKSVI